MPVYTVIKDTKWAAKILIQLYKTPMFRKPPLLDRPRTAGYFYSMPRIPDELIERIKDASDIVEIVSEYVQLKKSGRNYTGLCPFHNEKTPSFSVNPDLQIYKCFGCGSAARSSSSSRK